MNKISLQDAISALDGKTLDKVLSLRYERRNALYNETAQGSAGALTSTYKKKLALITAVLALSSVVIAVPLALNNANDRPAPVIPSGPLTTNGENSAVIPTAAPSASRAETTAPETTAREIKIAYKDGVLGKKIVELEESRLVCRKAWIGFTEPGHISFENAIEQWEFDAEEDSETLFYVMFDTYYGNIKLDIPNKDIEDFNSITEYLQYCKECKESKANIVIASMEKLGIPLKYMDAEYYIGYINKKDYEKMKELPVSGYLYMLPEDFSFDNWYYAYYNTDRFKQLMEEYYNAYEEWFSKNKNNN